MSKESDRIRVEWRAGDMARDAGLKTPENVVRFDDIFYGTEVMEKDPKVSDSRYQELAKWQKLDVYRPKDAFETDSGNPKKLPVIVNVHGGAWVYGDKEIYQFYCMSLVKYGFAVVNFTYRLAPEYKFPASIEDTNLVMKFIVENAEKYGFDLNNVFGVGDSAGANILGLYSCFLTNPDYQKEFSFEPTNGFRLRGVALNCGAYTFKIPDGGSPHNSELMEDLFENGGTKDELEKIDVPSHVTTDFPPAFIMTGSNDFLSHDALPLANRLMQCKVPFITRFWHHPQHNCYHVFHVNCRHPLAEKCNKEECGFFKTLMDD